MAVTWFSADQHFGHANVIGFCDRPFANVWEMDKALISAWNSVVGDSDTVYHLGDFSLSGNLNQVADWFWELNGKIHLLTYPWHHDGRWMRRLGKTFFPPHDKVKFDAPIVVLEHDPAITLCHYPMASWEKSHYNSWHLFGHTHDRYRPDNLSMDVGVDAAYRLFGEYRPFAMEEVEEIMKGRA